jgi:uncharacterized membrane protein YphA (DoxX/SURF4 family)
LAWVFVHAGVDVMRHPEPRAASAARLLGAVRSAAPVDLPDDVALVRANAAAQVAAGTALALGKAPRLAAAALLASLAATTVGGHPFWSFDEPTQRAGQRIHFDKNLGLAGGLLLVLVTPRRQATPAGRRGPSTPTRRRGR